MEKIWLKNYQAGVPAEINPKAYHSLNEIFDEACQKYREKTAFVNFGTTLSYQELSEKVQCFSAFLQSELNLKKGDRIALMLPNVLQYPIALFGALKAGLVVVNVNPLYTPRELTNQLNDAMVNTIIVLSNFAHTVEQAMQKTMIKNVIVTQLGDGFPLPKAWLVNFIIKYIKRLVPAWNIPGHVQFRKALALGEKHPFLQVPSTREDMAFLQYTGGTTGVAKGAIITHGNMVANLEQAGAWVKPVLKDGKEVMITALPLYHIFSLTANCLLFLKWGAKNILITNPRDIPAFVKELARYPFTAITGVNTLFNALLNNPNFAKVNFSALRITLGGGMSIQHAVANRWKEVTGVTLIEAYGLTEACPAVCINPLNLKEFNGTVGLPIPSTDISIRNESNQECGLNEPGELWIKGPQVISGYWKQAEETRETIVDGWLRTGDIATINEGGFVKIVDRKKDMIVISGFNVYPNEVEDIIALMPEVKEVAVIGVRSKTGDEQVKAFIVSRDNTLTEEKVIDFCRKTLTGYKIPKIIEFREELPKTNVGKILRRALREET